MFATLSKDPYKKSLDEIGNLTPYQVRNILFRPDNAEPTVASAAEVEAASGSGGFQVTSANAHIHEKRLFWKFCEGKGMTEEQIKERWVEKQKAKTGG